MKIPIFSSEETLFRDRMVLEYDHIPETFQFRKEQMNHICRDINPAFYGACPKNMILYGPSGTGKTTTMKKIFTQLKKDTKRIIPVLITCPTVKTEYAVFKKIYRAALNQEPPDRGVSIQHLIDCMGRKLAERDAVLLVCLDDAFLLWHDHILEDVLDILLRMHEEYQGFKTGVILTVNTTNISPKILSSASVLSSTSKLTGHQTTEQSVCTKTLDESIHAIFQPHEIAFPSYTKDEIRAIMTYLADKSLRQGAISPEIMEIIIKETVRLGNLRTGIDLLKTSVELAEAENRTSVSRADVRASLVIVRTTLPPAVTRLLDEKDQSILDTVAEIVDGTERTEEPMISGDVHTILSETIPVCYSFFEKRMIQFSNMGLVKLEPAKIWGNSRRIIMQYGAGGGVSGGVGGAARDQQNHG